jgi:hypothetical protein
MAFDSGSRSRLTLRDLPRFPSDSLFDRVGRAVCGAECLPRKELFEAWEVARRARRLFRGGRVVDLACGHGLLAFVMLLLDDTSPSALAVDTRMPASAPKIAEAMVRAWPRLSGRVRFEPVAVEGVTLDAQDLAVSIHACGALTDEVIASAIAGSARVAVLPCCHDKTTSDVGGLGGWLDAALAIDVTRAGRLRAAGYSVRTQKIPEAITPKNRLLLAERRGVAAAPRAS